MKKLVYILLFSLSLFSCQNDKGKQLATSEKKIEVRLHSMKEAKNQDTIFKPHKLISDFYITDIGYYDITIGDGIYAVIKRNNILVDTIDSDYSIKQIDDNKFIYQTISGNGPASKEDANPKYKKSISASLGDYTIFSNGKKELLNTLTPDFDDYFSSPAIINQHIFYWKIKRIDSTGKIAVSAAEFDPITRKTRSFYLLEDYLETDDDGYFPRPYIKNDTIYFDAGKNKLMRFSKDFKIYN
ncbi:MAG TPA: hypothetical protein VGN20_17480 [Mucilaginibacter sp.]